MIEKRKLSDCAVFIPDSYTNNDFWYSQIPEFPNRWILYDLSGERIKIYSERELNSQESGLMIEALRKGRKKRANVVMERETNSSP